MCDTTEQTIRSHAIQSGQACVIYGQVGNGRSATTGRHLFELGGIPERVPGESTQEMIRLEKSSFAFAFYTGHADGGEEARCGHRLQHEGASH